MYKSKKKHYVLIHLTHAEYLTLKYGPYYDKELMSMSYKLKFVLDKYLKEHDIFITCNGCMYCKKSYDNKGFMYSECTLGKKDIEGTHDLTPCEIYEEI